MTESTRATAAQKLNLTDYKTPVTYSNSAQPVQQHSGNPASTKREPAFYQYRACYDDGHWSWSAWDTCTAEQAVHYRRKPLVDGWHHEVRALYEAPVAAPKLDVEAERRPDVMRALKDACDLAMRNTLAARVPECGDFGAIAQDLSWVIDQFAATSTPAKSEPGEWISVEDRRPEDGQQVIVCHKTVYRNAPAVQSVGCAVFKHGGWNAHGHSLYTPTHWMPLPAAPSPHSPVGAKDGEQ